MTPDLFNFIDQNGLKIMLDLKGWKLSSCIQIKGLAIVKPDFYPCKHILAMGNRGYIYADGVTRIEYAGQTFSSTDDLLNRCGEDAILNFKDWVFLEEKEWVITDGNRWLSTFSNLSELPKRSTYRC
jgi:hypothetical protein